MNIIDSSLWFEYFYATLKDESLIGIIEDSENQYVPAICLYEVFKKIRADKDEDAALSSVSFMQNATVISMTPQIALQAAKISRECALPMADSIIYATAKTCFADIYTQDRHFEGLDGVHYFAKR